MTGDGKHTTHQFGDAFGMVTMALGEYYRVSVQVNAYSDPVMTNTFLRLGCSHHTLWFDFFVLD